MYVEHIAGILSASKQNSVGPLCLQNALSRPTTDVNLRLGTSGTARRKVFDKGR